MSKKCIPLEEPMNASERYLYAISERLDVLIDLLSKVDTPAPEKEYKPIVIESPAIVAPPAPIETKKVNNKKRVPKG